MITQFKTSESCRNLKLQQQQKSQHHVVKNKNQVAQLTNLFQAQPHQIRLEGYLNPSLFCTAQVIT